MEWQFALDGVEIDEPIGFNGISLNVLRDDRWHGVFFEASNTVLTFYGNAATILKTAKESYGVDAIVVFSASSRCEGQEDFTEALSGKLNFTNYQENCGDECTVRMSVEQDTCAMVFKNRFDQKVNIDSAIAFDKVTNLPAYTRLGFDMDLATQEIPISADAQVGPDGDILNVSDIPFIIADTSFLGRPVYSVVTDNSILTGQLNDPAGIFEDPALTFLISPQVLLEENSSCISTDYLYDIRMKGSAMVEDTLFSTSIELVVDYWDGNGTHFADAVNLHTYIITNSAVNGVTYTFDQTFSDTIPIPMGVGFYAYIRVRNNNSLPSAAVDINITFDPETSFLLSNTKACPPTDAEVYMVNETLARATESITDACLTIQSDYYGRTDSQPFASSTDGCGALRVLSPGLKIRQAADKDFFASMKELMEGLRAIDNIGMGMYSDRVRIEPAEWFYQDSKIMDLDLIPKARSVVEPSLVYTNIKGGYTKWEIKSIKGIDEFNSAKEYRTSIKALSNELDIRSNLIASGYIIENLRTQTLVNTGNTDSTYDNDIFIICVDRDGYGFHVEQGNMQDAANFFSPATAYNWRIRPMYNLMRWFKSIAQSYVVLTNTMSKIFFTSGTGNYLAEGMLPTYDNCRLENKVLAENDDLAYIDFENIDDATPIYKPEIITFEYPLSIADYQNIKANPYGYFNVQCGRGVFFKAYIKNLSYKPAEGKADFILIKAWQ
jgi:hypothetical protein